MNLYSVAKHSHSYLNLGYGRRNNPLVKLSCVCVSPSVVAASSRPHGFQPTGLLCPWDFPDKHTGVGCHFLLQGIFPTRVSCTAGRFFTNWAKRGTQNYHRSPLWTYTLQVKVNIDNINCLKTLCYMNRVQNVHRIRVLEKTLESPLDRKRSNQSILKEINPEYSWGEGEAPILWPPYVMSWLTGKDTDDGKDRRQKKGVAADEIVR